MHSALGNAAVLVLLFLTTTRAFTVPIRPQHATSTADATASSIIPNQLGSYDFNYKVPMTDISLVGSYETGTTSRLLSGAVILALSQISLRVRLHIFDKGDGPLSPADNPITELMRPASGSSTHEMVVRSYNLRFYGDGLTYGNIKDAVEGIEYLMVVQIRYHDFFADIVSPTGDKLGIIYSKPLSPSTAGLHNGTSADS
ncbi:hypothetical protein ACLMJK_008215 [Lecanora helva]